MHQFKKVHIDFMEVNQNPKMHDMLHHIIYLHEFKKVHKDFMEVNQNPKMHDMLRHIIYLLVGNVISAPRPPLSF